ncbi:mechanosensitive ion channel domain-containing protein [Massilibacteroides sp.]|uniref:mechanosensitive ion channel family protein n=1 Tax=Massilibacteroides sp. TaxID=2034766 RepID=UPI00261C0D90|nr:mechanosensitive ion channel domain-containing protein [Massilibacteroides sp.]MDD4514331.1 mechanosensitive ion channel [Massilibacteroides sp.]
MSFLANLLTIIPDTVTSQETETYFETLLREGAELGFSILKALIVFAIGKLLITLLNKLFRRILTKRKIDPSVKSFLSSLVNITLTILLIISVIGALGIQTTSFAALIASAGVAIGVALSGNLSNFAGGIVILLFKPFRVGDYIEAQGIGGTVEAIQIFHTILNTADNKQIYVPNGAMSSGVVTNYNRLPTRRIEWVFSITYGSDYDEVCRVIEDILKDDKRILPSPEPFIALHAMAETSVNIVTRVWVPRENYWNVYFDINRQVYAAFNEKGIDFPIPRVLLHKPDA